MNERKPAVWALASLCATLSACCPGPDYSGGRYLILAAAVEADVPPPAGSVLEDELLFDDGDRANDVLVNADELRASRRIMLYVLFSGGDIRHPSSEIIRLRQSDSGRVVDVVGRFEDDAPVRDGCGVDVIFYPITGLADGEYELLHPRSAVPAGFVWGRGDLPWEVVDGEEVARTRVALGPAGDGGASLDAGAGDAGP